VDKARPLLPSPHLILFDLDDTLCDYATARVKRLRLAFSLHLQPDSAGSNHDLPRLREETLDQMVSESIAMQAHGAEHFPTIMAKYGIDDESAAATAMEWYRSHPYLGLKLFPDAISTIDALRGETGNGERSTGRKIGIVTNGPAEVQRKKAALLGIFSIVDFVVISGEFGTWKPDRLIFDEALRLGGSAASDAVFIGDSIDHDMIGAAEAGVRTIWVNRHRHVWPTAMTDPDRVVGSLRDLLPILLPEFTAEERAT